MRVGISVALALVAVGATADEAKLGDEIRRTYDQAARAAKEGEPIKALVLIEGVLMVKPVAMRIDRATLPGSELRYEAGVRQAIAAWGRLPDSPFYLTDQPGADFTIQYVEQIPNRSHVQGLVQAQRNFRWGRQTREYTITGSITVQRLWRGRVLTGEEAGGVVAHEMGHLFGLADVDDPSMLMGPFYAGKPRREPSDAELRRVIEFREFLREQADRLRPTAEAMMAFTGEGAIVLQAAACCRETTTPHPRRASS